MSVLDPIHKLPSDVSDEELHAHFEMMAGHLRTIAEPMLVAHFGERRFEFSPHCPCCRRWKLLDDLVENPYEKVQCQPIPK